MSSVVSAISFWLFTAATVTGQYWLIAATAVSYLIGMLISKDRKLFKASALLLASSTVLMLVFRIFGPATIYLPDWFASVRTASKLAVRGVDSDSAALVLGLSIGDDSLVTSDLSDAMQITSLTHLMAVSGANCAIVIGAIYLLLYRFAIKTRVVVAILALAAYVLLVGAQPSVLRAAIMSSAVLIAYAIGRQVSAIGALALSVILLLVLSPDLATNYGFVLSVLATAGILIASPKFYELFCRRLPKPVAMALAVSCGAQLFCFPVLLGLQGGVPTYSLLANLICEPLVSPITVLGLIGVCLSGLPILASVCFWFASLFALPITLVAKGLATLPFATMPWLINWWGVLAAITAVAAILIVISSKHLALRNISAIMATVLAACSVGVVINQAVKISIWPSTSWQVASCDVGQGDATVIRSHEAIALVDVGRDESKIDACLSKLGVAHINILVLTHFDADHVAGLAGTIKSRRVDNAILTSYLDERPGADFSKFALQAAGISVQKSEAGMRGVLGEVKWQVLSPSRSAAEAVDPNDGSIVMTWNFPTFQLITMADLGEPGQQRLAQSIQNWQSTLPIVLKVSHHGSADQYPELIEALAPRLALISVGKNNGYGHPTKRTLSTLSRAGSTILRTDLLGSIAIDYRAGQFEMSSSGAS